MTLSPPDIAGTLFVLPADAKFLPVAELSPRLRAKIGPGGEGQSVLTRPGLRVTTRLVPAPLAGLITEFRQPSLLTDAVLRFARAHDQDASAILDMAFDALATLVEARILVQHESPDAAAPAPSLSAGQAFAGFEIEAMVRSLDDSEVYRARGRDDSVAALKVARDDNPAITATLTNEARVLEFLQGADSPELLEHGTEGSRAFIAMEWCDGVSVAVAAQQARAARDRGRVHDLVSRMLDAYGRLHANGLLHGDVHPGNCLVRDDGRIFLLDFGNARSINGAMAAVDPTRAGIVQFYDPLMAGELLAGRLPPAATPASEQYAIAVLAYLLLTGLHPIETPAEKEELLRRISERRPLPFTARGVAAWPDVEAVVNRGLARQPDERYPDVASLARAFASAHKPMDMRRPWHESAQPAFDRSAEGVRTMAPSSQSTLDRAWFGLRAALALEDAELLAASDLLARRAGTGWAAQAIVAHVARARSDSRMESKAIAGFLAATEPMPAWPEAAAATLAAANILERAATGSNDVAALADWAARAVDRLGLAKSSTRNGRRGDLPSLTLIALALGKSGAVPIPADLPTDLEALCERQISDVWLWALAHDIYGDDRFKAFALGSRLPRRRLGRGLALLRLHQLTGDMRWVIEAGGLVTAPHGRSRNFDNAILMTELMAPERAALPPFLFPLPRIGDGPHELHRAS